MDISRSELNGTRIPAHVLGALGRHPRRRRGRRRLKWDVVGY